MATGFVGFLWCVCDGVGVCQLLVFSFCFEGGFHYVALARSELLMQTRLAFKLMEIQLPLPSSAGIKVFDKIILCFMGTVKFYTVNNWFLGFASE